MDLKSLPFHRRARFRPSIQTCPEPTDEQNDAHTAQLPGYDARHAGKHAWDDGIGQAIPNGLQAPAQHSPGPDTTPAATGQTGESVYTGSLNLSNQVDLTKS